MKKIKKLRKAKTPRASKRRQTVVARRRRRAEKPPVVEVVIPPVVEAAPIDAPAPIELLDTASLIDLPLAEKAPRAFVLNHARELCIETRESSYGDPLENFRVIGELQDCFWTAVERSKAKKFEPYNAEVFNQNTAFGHAIDMIMTQLARIATTPLNQPQIDRFIDGAAYFAIAHEVAERAESL